MTAERLTYNYAEAAEALGVHPDTVRAMVQRGDIRVVPFVGRRVLIAKAEIDRLLRASTRRAS